VATAQTKRRRGSESESSLASSSTAAAARPAKRQRRLQFDDDRLESDEDEDVDEDENQSENSAAAAAMAIEATEAATTGFANAAQRRAALLRDYRAFMAKNSLRPFLAAGMQIFVETDQSSFDSVIIDVELNHLEGNHLVTFTHASRDGPMINHENKNILDEKVQSITIVSPFWQQNMEPHVIKPLKDKSIILVPGHFDPQRTPYRREHTSSVIAVGGRWPAEQRFAMFLLRQSSRMGKRSCCPSCR
jgi:hypothetical protein